MYDNNRLMQLREALTEGVRKGWSGFLWMMKIIIPVSFLTMLLAWSGVLERLNPLIGPAMNLLHLPSAAALPLLIGMLTGIYGGIASMAVLPFTTEEMTLIAIFLLIAHNLIQESIIQGKSGVNPFVALIFRLCFATVTVLIVAPFLGMEGAGTGVPAAAAETVEHSLRDALTEWAGTTLVLSIQIFGIIMGILTSLEILKALGWTDHIVRAFTPLLKIMGLSRQVAVLWMTAVIFGLSYGGAVIVEEARAGNITREELRELHLSIGINHSMIEDPTLFLPLGIGAFWLWVPRFVMALAAVRLLTLWYRLRARITGVTGGPDGNPSN